MQCPFDTLKNAAHPDKCLVVNANQAYNGNKLQLWSCSGDEQKKMWYPVSGPRRLSGAAAEQTAGEAVDSMPLAAAQVAQTSGNMLQWSDNTEYCMSVDNNVFQN